MNLITNWINKYKTKDSQPPSLYDLIGGEQATRCLCEKFYDIMESDPSAKELLDVHSEDLSVTRQKFYEFMSGWLGGPGLFEEKYGHPRLRARHLHVTINQTLIDQWLHCMYQALTESIEDKNVRLAIWQNLVPLANHMKNTDS